MRSARRCTGGRPLRSKNPRPTLAAPTALTGLRDWLGIAWDTHSHTTSPARLYELVFGIVLVGAGILGFFYSSDFGDPGDVDAVRGILDVNGWHNIAHIASGALGLVAYSAGANAARTYALGLGDGDAILSIVPVNTEDNILHLLIGIAGLAAGAATPAAAPGQPRSL